MNKIMRERYRQRIPLLLIPIIVLMLLLGTFGTRYAYAAVVHSGLEMEVVFVIDTSYSMNDNDKEKISVEVLNMFMDMSESARTQIGYVIYNDQIVASQSLSPINSTEEKSIVKNKLASIHRYGYTDLGLGLKKGHELFLETNTNENKKKLMILLTDGEIELGSGSERTYEESENDIAHVINEAKQKKYPIYTVGLNSDNTVNEERLEHIAAETGGATYMTKTADALPDIFNMIFANYSQTELVPIAAITANGQLQEVKVDIPNSHMDEVNVVLLSQHPISESHLYHHSTDAEIIKSNHYVLIKIKDPQKEQFLLKFKGEEGDLVKVNMLSSDRLQAELDFSTDSMMKDKPVTIESRLLHPDKKKLMEDQEFISALKAELIVIHKDSGRESRFPMKNGKGVFKREHTFSKAGTYETKVSISDGIFYKETPVKTFKLINAPYRSLSPKPMMLYKGDDNTKIDLNDYFIDPDDDKLFYEITSNGEGKTVNAVINDHYLVLSPIKAGSTSVTVAAKNGEGESISTSFTFNVKSYWNSTPVLVGLLVIIFITTIMTIYFITKRKSAFSGRLKGYFFQTASGNHMPIKYWPLAAFRSKKQITLQELLISLDVNEMLPEAERIFFIPGENNILIKHYTHCSILKDGMRVPKNKKAALINGDKLYIAFEDGKTEMSLTYHEKRPNFR